MAGAIPSNNLDGNARVRWGRVALTTVILVVGLLIVGIPFRAYADEGTPAEAGETVEEETPGEGASEGGGAQGETPEPTIETSSSDGESDEVSLESDDGNSESGEEQGAEEVEQSEFADPPYLAYLVADSPECRIAPESESAVRSGGYIEFACSDQVSVHAERMQGNEIEIVRTIEAVADGIWDIQLADDSAGLDPVDLVWSQPSPIDVETTQTAQLILANELDDRIVEMNFRVRLHRPDCSMTAPELRFVRSTFVEAGEVTAVQEGNLAADSMKLMADLAPIPQPSLSFAGPIDFGSVSADSSGLSATTLSGSVTLQIDGLDQSCGAWVLVLSFEQLLDASSSPLAGSTLLVIGVDGQPDDGPACDLQKECVVLRFHAGAIEVPSRTLILELKLQLAEESIPGQFQASLEAELVPVDAT